MKNLTFEIEVIDRLSGTIKKLGEAAISLAETLRGFKLSKRRSLLTSKHSGRKIFAYSKDIEP